LVEVLVNSVDDWRVVLLKAVVVFIKELVGVVEEIADIEVDMGAVEDTVPNAAGKRFPIGHPAFAHGLLIQHP
jgi:hypothetical protein